MMMPADKAIAKVMNGFVRVYDCGQDTYEWFKKKDI